MRVKRKKRKSPQKAIKNEKPPDTYIKKIDEMEKILLALTIILIWMIAQTYMLSKMKIPTIVAIGDFYKKVLPVIPFTKIFDFFKRKGKQKDEPKEKDEEGKEDK